MHIASTNFVIIITYIYLNHYISLSIKWQNVPCSTTAPPSESLHYMLHKMHSLNFSFIPYLNYKRTAVAWKLFIWFVVMGTKMFFILLLGYFCCKKKRTITIDTPRKSFTQQGEDKLLEKSRIRLWIWFRYITKDAYIVPASYILYKCFP